MRRLFPAVLTVALLVALAAPAGAHPGVPLEATSPTDLSFSATDNVEYLGRFPEHSGTAGGQLSPNGKFFYLTDPRGVYVYDVRKPASPTRLGSLTLFQTTTGMALAQEDPNSNGRILLVDGASTPAGTAQLHVVDVSNPRSLKVLDTVDVTDHTWTCVSGRVKGKINSCAYAYGRTGHIVDLTNPAKARLLDTTWRKRVRYGDRSNTPYTHDLTEIRPGLVMSAGSTAILMGTSNPAKPVRLRAIKQPDRFSSLGYHSVEWGGDGRDRYLVAGTEIAPSGPLNAAGSDCEGENSVIETWDARQIHAGLKAFEKKGTSAKKAFAGRDFKKVDSYDAGSRGLFLDGQAPGHVLYCAHWMELHPDFKRGGRMAVSYYDRGTRFVDVRSNGKMKEVGWITPADGYSGSPQWISDNVVYIMDYRRGMEMVRLTDKPATKVNMSKQDRIAASSVFVPPPTDTGQRVLYFATLALGAVLVHYDRRRRKAVSRR